MKTLLLCLLVTLGISFWTFGQTTTSSLLDDSTFALAVAKVIRYPVNARQQQLVAKVYTSFRVGEQGKIDKVQILNIAEVVPAFQEAVIDALMALPNRESRFKGTYTLPVTFQLEGKSASKSPNYDDKKLSKELNGQTLLSEVFVVGYI